jgi:hypothetical protein
LEVFGRRPPQRVAPPVSGRHPKTFTKPVIIKVSTCFPVFPQSGRLAPVVVSPTHIAIQIHEFEAERLKVVRADTSVHRYSLIWSGSKAAPGVRTPRLGG